jgi:hypothetical protein
MTLPWLIASTRGFAAAQDESEIVYGMNKIISS